MYSIHSDINKSFFCASAHRSLYVHRSSLVLDLVDQCANVRKQFNGELISTFDEFLGFLGRTDTRRGAGQDDCASGQCSTLREKADELRHVEDQVAMS